MNKIFAIWFCLWIFSFSAYAQSTPRERRVEQEKRESLSLTQDLGYEKKELIVSSSGSIDQKYFHSLLDKKISRISDGLNTLITLLGLQKNHPDFQSQLKFFQENKVLPEYLNRDLSAELPLRKGLAAYMFCRALNIKGGLWMRIFNVNQRYAVKELVYMDMMLPGNVEDFVSGKELILLLTKSAEYLAQGR